MPAFDLSACHPPDRHPGTREELDDIAKRLLDSGKHKSHIIDKERCDFVSQALGDVVSEFLKRLNFQVSSPTAKELTKKVSRLLTICRDLEEELESLPEFFFEYQVDLAIPRYWAPPGSDWNPPPLPNRSERHILLNYFTIPLRKAAEDFIEFMASRRGFLYERRGPQRALQHLVGDARAFLASKVVELIIQERGSEPLNADEGGLVAEIVGALWFFSTRLPEDGANLPRFVRDSVRKAQLYIYLFPNMKQASGLSEEVRERFSRQSREKLEADLGRLSRRDTT